MKNARIGLLTILTVSFLLGAAISSSAQVTQVNMALNLETQKLYLAVRTHCDFEGYFDIEPESLIVPGYSNEIIAAVCLPDCVFMDMVDVELQIVPGLELGQLVTFHVDIFDNDFPEAPVASVDDELEVQMGSLDDLMFGYRDPCVSHVPSQVAQDQIYCLWLCHRTYIIPIVCPPPIDDVPIFRIRPGCHQYIGHPGGQHCNTDTCSNDADESVLSWHVTIIDTTNCIAFLVIIYCDAAPGCACLEGPDWILPVELASFDAIPGDGYVDLSWRTASERDNSHFDLWRSINGQNWTTIARIPGQGTTQETHQYSYRDVAVVNGVNYQYALESVDINGERHVYDYMVTATPDHFGVPTSYALAQNFPNPFNATTSFEFALRESGPVSLKIHDLLGREVATVVEGWLDARRYQVSWSADGLPSGVYLYTLKAGSFVQTRKLLLLK
ncbi:MAG: T9SS type A sorting domain-containing protein [bacterium]